MPDSTSQSEDAQSALLFNYTIILNAEYISYELLYAKTCVLFSLFSSAAFAT